MEQKIRTHPAHWRMLLVDDGSLDTVVRCSGCGAEFRFSWDGGENYSEFVDQVLDDAAEIHVEEDLS